MGKILSINVSFSERIEKLSQELDKDIEEMITMIVETGLEKLEFTECKICSLMSQKSAMKKCDNKYVHCGYVEEQFSSTWEGESSLDDPSTTCYQCILEGVFDNHIDVYVNYDDGPDLSDIEEFKKNYKEIITQEISDDSEEPGDGYTITQMDKVKEEHHPPENWIHLQEYVHQQLDKLVKDWEEDNDEDREEDDGFE